MVTIGEIQNNLIGLSHSGTLNKVRNIYSLYERAANNMLSKIKLLESIRTVSLAEAIHDKLYTYSAPEDYRSLIGIYPSGDRQLSDEIVRAYAEQFDRRKEIDTKKISIESVNGQKVFRVNWKIRSPKIVSNMDSYNGNGTWTVVGTASGIQTDTQYKYSGNGSVRFDVATTGDGIQNITLASIDLTDEEDIADFIIPVYFKDATEAAKVTGITFNFGNSVSIYSTGITQTAQFDGTPFKAGWNIIQVPWSGATDTGSVSASAIDFASITFTVTSAVADIRVDNILCSLGTIFDVKYYSKYLFQTAAGVWIPQPTVDTDLVICDSDSINIFLYECMDEIAHQVEGKDSKFDMAQVAKKLWGDPKSIDSLGRIGLYAQYRAEHPGQAKKAITDYGMRPKYRM